MSLHSLPPSGGDAHVEAFCCTGTSPGRDGSTLAETDAGPARIRYEIHGPAGAPVVVVLGGISADHHLAPTALDPTPGWWPGVVGPGLGLDPTHRRIVGVEWAVPGGSGERGRTPSTFGQARAVRAVLDHEGIDDATLVGASYGGMVALAFAEAWPDLVRRLVIVCAAHRSHPMATALRSIQRSTVRFGARAGFPDDGLSLARQLAMTTYRSAEEFEDRFGSEGASGPGRDGRFPVESYLEARGRAFVGRMTPERFLALSASIDEHRVDPSAVTAPTSLVSFDTDTLVPPWLVQELQESLAARAVHHRLRSPFGHDAFLKEPRAMTSVLRSALGAGEDDR